MSLDFYIVTSLLQRPNYSRLDSQSLYIGSVLVYSRTYQLLRMYEFSFHIRRYLEIVLNVCQSQIRRDSILFKTLISNYEKIERNC